MKPLQQQMMFSILLGCAALLVLLNPTLTYGQQAAGVPLFDAEQAYQYIQAQVRFGPRVPNTQAHRACGAYLQQQLSTLGAQVVVQEFQAEAFDGQQLALQNIIARFNPDCPQRILLVAHWDTRPMADKDSQNTSQPIEGANDGASGVGVLLSIAQTLHQHPPEGLGVDIILFDGEDHGPPHGSRPVGEDVAHWCLGTQHWILNPHMLCYRALYGILLDMVGARGATFYRDYYSMECAAGFVEQVWKAAHQLGHGRYFPLQNSEGYLLDDHVFLSHLARIPMVAIVDHNPKHPLFKAYHHTHQDNLQLIDKQTLRAVGETVLHMIYTTPLGR